MKKALVLAIAAVLPTLISQQALAEYNFFQGAPSAYKYSVSAGWLHASPEGDANPMNNSTIISQGTTVNNGAADTQTVINTIIPGSTTNDAAIKTLNSIKGAVPVLPANLSGTATVNGLQNWTSANTGLKAKNTDTLGLLFEYHMNDKWSAEFKAGIPPTVDIEGKGQIYAPFSGTVTPSDAAQKATGLTAFTVKKDIPITDMTQGNGVASSARAWLPAAELQYHFDKIGTTKIRPYVGVGVMYAYFDNVKVASGIDSDLKVAGQRIQQIKDGYAAAALTDSIPEVPADTLAAKTNMKVKAKADNAFAPLLTLGATYDITDRVYAVGSLSYAKLKSATTITVDNTATGQEIIKAKTNLDINPFITYVGLGYRF